MDPFRLDRVQPGAFAGQWADHETDSRSALFDLPIVLPNPLSDRLAAVPGGVIPDQQQGLEALRGEPSGAPGQKCDGDRTHGAPDDKPEPQLVRLRQSGPS